MKATMSGFADVLLKSPDVISTGATPCVAERRNLLTNRFLDSLRSLGMTVGIDKVSPEPKSVQGRSE
ncbi:MAG: hypothetical protein JW749_12405 [Sedimentisphaerales bacterium]|nr:hypothetical protein [Sedimentisphaerales bacterium]